MGAFEVFAFFVTLVNYEEELEAEAAAQKKAADKYKK